MAVIDRNPHTKYEKFLEKLVEFPYIRVAIFAFIAAIVFFFLGLQSISNLFFFMIPQAIIGRVLSVWLCGAQYTITKFWATSLFIGIELNLAATALRPFGNVARIVATIGGLAIFLAAIGFLIRIFIALFDR